MDPRTLADVVLAVAVRAACDSVFVEPAATDPERYTISFERAQETVRTISVDAGSGSAAVARLALVAELDLAAAHAQSARVPVRSGDRRAEVVITIRPGDGLRAELLVVPAPKPARAAPVATSTKLGDVIGNYRIAELLGEGGMGTVFRVEHVVLGRSYALKVLRAKVFERDVVASQRFLREARAAARVRHPNIVDVFDFGHLTDGRPYLVMELLDGESLLDRVSRGALPPQHVVAIARQIAHALAAVHDVGVIHADVTPSNAILLAGDSL
ncbi:MAG: serine/threonine-protein kinase, partial [Acidobacteriota bacterium]